MRAVRIGLAVATLATGPGPVAAAAQDPEVAPANWYGRGLALVEAGRWQDALDLWEEASEELSAQGVQDPRIGVAHIETAVRHGATDRHADASRMVLWGFSGDVLAEGIDALHAEVDRITLIVDDDEQARWRALRDSDPRELALALKRFWIERDPTPGTPLNERLIEHWTRIETARERYVYNQSSVIGTDDRGEVYLRYGAPGRVRRGSLGASELELNIRLPRDDAARQQIRRLDVNPQYEVWVYDQLNDQEFTMFLFGNVDGTGPFELVEGVHRLIPPQSRSRNTARYVPGGIPASYFLELFYYQDLSAVGGMFGERFSELEILWNNYTERRRGYVSASRQVPEEGELESLSFRYRTQDEFDPRGAPNVASLSDFEGRARDELVAQMVRLLSEDGVPVLMVLAASAPRLTADRRDAYRSAIDLPAWTMRHTLLIRDTRLDEVGRLVQPVDPERADLSTFVIRHPATPLHLTVMAQTLTPARPDSTGILPDTLVASDRLPGLVHFVPSEPLTRDTTRFEMSDLALGTPVPPEVDRSLLPFDLLPSTTIWRRDPLRVYFELYHLGLEGGAARVSGRFRVIPLTPEGAIDDDAEVLAIDDVTLSPEAATYRQFFDIALRDRAPGRYRLEVEITDHVRGSTLRRTADFELAR